MVVFTPCRSRRGVRPNHPWRTRPQREAANASQLRRHFNAGTCQRCWPLTCEQVMVGGSTGAGRRHRHAEKQVDIKLLAERGVEIFFAGSSGTAFSCRHYPATFSSTTNPDDPRYMAVDCAIVGQLDEQDLYYLARNLSLFFSRTTGCVPSCTLSADGYPPTPRWQI